MEDDLQIIDAYLSGASGAAEELVMRYQKQIYSFLYRMTGNMEDAKDLVQQTFIQAVMNLGSFRRESSFKTWLYQIALNTGRNHIRRYRHNEVEAEESIMANEDGALATLMERQTMDHIRQGMEKLPERQRLAVTLRVNEGLSCGETAKVMGCSEGAVKTHYHLGVKKLRMFLKEKGHEIHA